VSHLYIVRKDYILHASGDRAAWFQWVALPFAPEAVAPAYWAVPSVGGDMEVCTGGRGSVRLDQVVQSALEAGRAVAPALPPVTRADGR
jgi:hypothetical protein